MDLELLIRLLEAMRREEVEFAAALRIIRTAYGYDNEKSPGPELGEL